MWYCRLYWGDIQLERWILENAGNAATQVTISLFQVFSDVINGAEHINKPKLEHWVLVGILVGGTVGLTIMGTPATGATYYYFFSTLIIGAIIGEGVESDNYGSWWT